MRARTAHAGYGTQVNGYTTEWASHAIIIEHDCPMKSHPSRAYVPEPIPFDYGTGIQAAFNIITSDCSIHHGRAAYAHARNTHHNSTREFVLDIQRAEQGEGFYTLRSARPTFKGELFIDELTNAGALEGADKHDDWGFEGTQLPQFKMGFNRTPITSSRDDNDGYARLPRRERFQRHPKTFALIDTWK